MSINDVTAYIDRLQYLMQRLEQHRRGGVQRDSELMTILSDLAFSTGMVASGMRSMIAEHEQMKVVLRWFLKGDLEEHIDEVTKFVDGG